MRHNKSKKLNKNIEEDLIFAKRTEDAWKRCYKGEFISMSFDDFLKQIKEKTK